MKLFHALTAVAAVYSVNTLAQTERDLESHVHGAASLNVAISKPNVFIELNTPWNNLVGFEHTPQTDDQRLLVETALQQLNDPTQLFAFNAGDCSLAEIDVESAMTDEQHGDDDEHHNEHEDEHEGEHKENHEDEHEGEHKDDHEDEHEGEHKENHEDEHEGEHKDDHEDGHETKDAHGEDHDDEHAHDDEKGTTHTAVLATYSYECSQIDRLKTIDATLFSIWPRFESLDIQLIGDKGQTLVELSPNNTTISLDKVK